MIATEHVMIAEKAGHVNIVLRATKAAVVFQFYWEHLQDGNVE
jgi:hypothetical protein